MWDVNFAPEVTKVSIFGIVDLESSENSPNMNSWLKTWATIFERCVQCLTLSKSSWQSM